MPRLTITLLLALAAAWAPSRLAAQPLPECDGDDPRGARVALTEGTALLQDAIAEARRRGARVRVIAESALARFDRQCALGDPAALAERGAALMLMGEPLRSAQSYDAFLRVHPLSSLDGRRRRRIEANLQPGEAIVELDRGSARLVVDGLDFGPLPRSTAVRLPPGAHRFEAHDAEGDVLASASATLVVGEAPALVRLVSPRVEVEPDATPDFSAWYVASAALGAASLATGIGFVFAVDERQRAYDEVCTLGLPATGCEAVLVERDAALGASIAGFVLAGLSIAALVTIVVIDLEHDDRPIAIRWGGTSLALEGTFR
ncbi:hypothetical protein [Sandaracinus amylolyticus]|uniref:PEGA domain-containing protein n=1 Tax=Sandaracinus amylolyticus TaxID=927083 RepID=A0A0F6W9K6_9BACT|nr:hypothetical protein [Sandaracinus amylolyticus]AKF10846.1 hypothetical protein DB32_007995 [Sandaracinus amylolyticus]